MYYNPRIKEIDSQLLSIQQEIIYGESLRNYYGNQSHIIAHLEQLNTQKEKLKREKVHILRKNY